jgi:hypothetical protein
MSTTGFGVPSVEAAVPLAPSAAELERARVAAAHATRLAQEREHARRGLARVLRHLGGERDGARHAGARGHHLVGEARGERLVDGDRAAREEPTHGRAARHEVDEV